MKTRDLPLSKVKPADTAMELKCVVMAPVLEYMKARYGVERVREFIVETEMNPDYVMNVNNWISYPYLCRVLAKLVEVSGDPMAPFLSARAHHVTSAWKAVGYFLTHLGTPATTYRLAVRFHSLWDNGICDYKLLEITDSSCRVWLKYRQHKQDPNNCLAIQGAFASFPRQFGLPYAEITEEQCACRGADACIYAIRWVNEPSFRRSWIGAAAGAVVGGGLSIPQGWGSPYWMVPCFCALGCLAGRVADYRRRLKDIHAQNDAQAASLLESAQALDALNRKLQAQVETRTEELSRANKALEQAIRDLKANQEKMLQAERDAAVGVLAAGMAHEINNPCNAIRLCLEGCYEDIGSEPRLRSHLEILDRSTRRCRRIVDDLLSFSREPSQDTAVRIEKILQASVDLFRAEHLPGIEIAVSLPEALPLLCLDQRQIQHVFLILLANASESMSGKGLIEISLAGEGDELVCRVRDHGPGMRKEVMERLFKPFVTSHGEGGNLGLGLSIARELMRKNNGILGVESRDGEGSVFSMRFPVLATPMMPSESSLGPVDKEHVADRPLLDAPPASRSTDPLPDNGPVLPTGIRLLLVEDDSDNAVMLTRMLGRRGVDVTVVANAEDGLDRFSTRDIDAVVSDIRLGGMSGVDLLARIRERDPDFPVILLTAYDSLTSVIQAVRLDAQDYILKPLENVDTLLRPIERAVRHHRLLMEKKDLESSLRQEEAKLRKLTLEVVTAEERERRRLAEDIHDSIAQILTISHMRLDALRDHPGAAQVSKTIEQVCTDLGQAVAETRSLTFQLHPPVLYQYGIEAALADLASTTQATHGIGVEFRDDGQPKPLDDSGKSLLFRCVREAVINSVKHAQARNITIAIFKRGDSTHVTVRDDGLGLPDSTGGARGKSFGLASIAERLGVIGGGLAIDSPPDGGTCVDVWVPTTIEGRKVDQA